MISTNGQSMSSSTVLLLFSLLLSYLVIIEAASSSTTNNLSMLSTSSSSLSCYRSKISKTAATYALRQCYSPSSNRHHCGNFRSSSASSAAAFISPSRAAAFTTTSHHKATTRVFQINNNMMGFANSEEPNDNNTNDDDDKTTKWESLYNNYQPQSAESIVPSSSSPPSAPAAAAQQQPTTSKSEIKIITFDLDNTLWKTSETITHANTVLFEYIQDKFGIGIRSEVEMGRLFREFPDRYCGLLDEATEIVDGRENGNTNDDESGEMADAEYASSVENVGRSDTDDGVHIQTTQQVSGTSKTKKKKKPVYLTLLRKDAIRSLILQQQQGNDDVSPQLSPIELEQEVDTAFQLWMEARSQSISQNFAPFALETLAQLKSSLISPQPTATVTTSDANQSNKKVYIGAITDGNSNPQSVPELYGLFDFVIKAEDVGVSKPDKRVYKAAVGELMVQLMNDGRSVEEFFLGDEFSEVGGGDVATATDASYLMSNDDDGSSIPKQPSWKDVDPDAVDAFSEAVGPWWVHIGDDFFKDIVAAKEFRMRSVWMRELIGGAKAFGGADEGTSPGTKKRSVEDLVNDIAKNNGAITMAIGDSDFLTSALHEEFSDAILDRFADLSDLLVQWNEEGKGSEADDENEAMAYPNTEPILSEASTVTTPSVALAPPLQSDESERVPTKFCFACGEKIPVVAKFCPGCGERQS